MRAMLWGSVIVLVLSALVGAGRLWAEDREKKAAQPGSCIALLNLTYVIQKYDKYRDFQEQLKSALEPFQRKDAAMRRRGEKLRVEYLRLNEMPTSSTREAEQVKQKKETIEIEGKQLQREMEDNQAEAKHVLGKKNEAGMKTMYQDVQTAVERYARTHQYAIVLQYNDATTPDLYYSTQNIARKISTGDLLPLTSTPGIDISKELVDFLNLGPQQTP